MRFATIRRVTTATAAAAVLGIGTAACGGGRSGGVDHAKLVSTIKSQISTQGDISQSELKKLPSSYYDCVANVFDKYIPSDQLKKLVDGKIKPTDLEPNGKNKAEGSAALQKCTSDMKTKIGGK